MAILRITRRKASGRVKTTCQGFKRESEAPAELGVGSAGVCPSRYKQCCRSPKGPYSGVTLVEVTISVMIMGILAAVASPIYSNSLLRYRVDVTAQRIGQDIVQTQRISRQTNSSRTIAFALTDHSYTISGINSLDRASQPYKVLLSQPPYRAELQSLVTAALPTTQLASVSIVFDRFGMPDQGISVTVKAGTFQKRIDVAPTSARVTVQ